VKRIGILVVAYNAVSTLAQVLDRIPREFVPRISEILVGDDHSRDSTYLVGLGYQQQSTELPLTVVRHPRNLGYGGNQKAGYRWAIESDLDVVVLLHGDGQYAPEILPKIVEPLEVDKCDAVLGSRMMEPGAARLGGMPLYKYVGNRILTRFENAVTGMDLTEWHSGYRAYSVDALRNIPFEQNSDGFDFDTQIILQLLESGQRIEEIPIPTYYGDEICYVDGIKYAKDVSRQMLRYRAHKIGFGSGEAAFASRAYEPKLDPDTSHGRILSWVADRRPGRVLDLGCSDGALAAELRTHAHQVTGVDIEEHPVVRDRVDAFVAADLDAGVPDAVGKGYDVIVAADVLEHVREPEPLLASLAARLAPGGSIITCVPNFGHWYPRLRVALGRFDYDRRGILDRDHLRFFTRKSLERMIVQAGYSVRRKEFLTLPVEVVQRGGPDQRASAGSNARQAFKRLDRIGTALRPTLFAYQFLHELEPTP
jgi:glycosyltransferase involved in cell wall biosynthesis/ubiquinone/menaquinone biosynthesis C-methylase UbiE